MVPGLVKASPRGAAAPQSSRAGAPAGGGGTKGSARGRKPEANPLGAPHSARGKGPKDNPLGGGSGASQKSMRANSPRRKAADAGPGERPGSQPSGSGSGGATDRRASAAPPKPSTAPVIMRTTPRQSVVGGGRKQTTAAAAKEEPPPPENPCLVTSPTPPLPANMRKPPFPIVCPAGARPRGRVDGAPSRHELAPQLGVSLLFNCFKARFEVISGDISTLSDHDPYDLKGPRSQQSIGRIKISPEKGTPVTERVEFPNVWLSAEQHGVLHDGYQGEGALDLKVRHQHLRARARGRARVHASPPTLCPPL
jgi:hypothetical protein